MTITQQEYNAVVDGLRTQLLLHRRHEDDLNGRIDAANYFIAQQAKEIEKLKAENMAQLIRYGKEKADWINKSTNEP